MPGICRVRYPCCVETSANPEKERAQAGLCAGCGYARRIASARGAHFLLCQRSADDPAYVKYPRLPVLACPGYTPASPHSNGL